MNKTLLALYGLKWNPFAPAVPAAALQVSPVSYTHLTLPTIYSV